ncbi:MAG: T9SS type A sorting domain-containing protein [Candidatus Poribacteria bacterium]|nr:T9SS type A sorting domain-containing protein [Candidatus Poribacteria bacterium]MDE0503723.1 T9SS type A sorting domain-containing protein [Candidatus Poribacteria bacterium]
MKTANLIRISLAVAIVCASANVTALAQKDVRLIPADTGGTDNDEVSIGIGTKYIILGTPGSGQDFATIFEGEGDSWKQTAQLTGDGASFGQAVAITDVRGRSNTAIAIVGAPFHNGVGEAHVFALSGRDWNIQSRIRAKDGKDGDNFGHAVSVNGDTALIGAPKDDEGAANSGAVYVFVRQGARWNQQAKLKAKNPARSDGFGEAVALLGNTAIIGAPQTEHEGVKFAGAAYVYEREGDRWVEKTKLAASDPGKADRFGFSVAVAADTVVVGAPLKDTAGGQDAGAAYIFGRDGNSWKQLAKVSGKGGRKGDKFGTSVATNGNVAIVGAPIRNEDAFGSGAAYAYARVDGAWQAKEKVVPKNGAKDLHFGASVGINENTVAIASHHKTKCDDCGWPHGDGSSAFVYSSIESFGTPPFGVDPIELKVTTLGSVKRTALFQNYPNPFNPETWVPYRLAVDAPVDLRIYNVQGKLVRELNFGIQEAGSYRTQESAAYWDGRDQFGEVVSSGMYFYTIQAGAFQATRRMLVLK